MKRIFNIGEKYIICKPSGSEEEISEIGPGWMAPMNEYDGRIVTIKKKNTGYDEESSASVYIDGWFFLKDWLIPYEDEEHIEALDILSML